MSNEVPAIRTDSDVITSAQMNAQIDDLTNKIIKLFAHDTQSISVACVGGNLIAAAFSNLQDAGHDDEIAHLFVQILDHLKPYLGEEVKMEKFTETSEAKH